VLGSVRVTFAASGREALRIALRALAAATGRDEVVLPAYTCWSVAAAAVAAGLRVRLVDVDERGRIETDALPALERAACVVVCNLFGIAEPIARIAERATAAGALVVDDAAQSFGASGADGAAGARGALGVLSFGRGKPLQALGGGAVIEGRRGFDLPVQAPSAPRVSRTWLRAQAWNLALQPAVFAALSATPAFGVGETRFDPGFRRGPMAGDALLLCAHALARFEARRQCRVAVAQSLARSLSRRTGFEPVLAEAGARASYPRLAALAPDRAARDAAVLALGGVGVARLYPAPLDAIPSLRPHRADPGAAFPGARALCDRLLTLPIHGDLDGDRWRAALDVLARISETRR
jgi:dTDP-4-amino-4,6-dideoxygalactose transaminase